MDDKQIIRLYFERSQEAIDQTKRKYGKLCKSLARRLLHSREDAEECVNDTYLAAWNSIPPNDPASLSAYLAKITRNLAMNRLSHNHAAKRHSGAVLSFEELDGCIPHPGGTDEKMDELALRESIIAFLQTQSAESRNIFIRRYFFFDSLKEISQRYGISRNKAASSLMRTRNKLKEYLIKEELYYDR